MNYLGPGMRQYLVLAVIVVVLTLYPSLRPDRGIFPLWPLAAFILAGYALAHFGTSRWNRVPIAGAAAVLSAAVIACFVYYRVSPNNRTLSGILLAMAVIFLLSGGSLWLENRGWLIRIPANLLIRFGQYPLTLYFFQQAATLAGHRFGFRLDILDSATGNWSVQAAVLVFVMFVYTFALERVAVLRMEWWLRQIEAGVMAVMPDADVFKKGYRF
jgi:4-amino-4-deoxy-L-arabinose transferase-like glycosyltransferase